MRFLCLAMGSVSFCKVRSGYIALSAFKGSRAETLGPVTKAGQNNA